MDLILQEIKSSGYSKILESLFETEPQNAIEKSQSLICHISNFSTYKDFLDYHVKNARISTCQNEWNEKRLAIHCFNCSANSQSCVCLSCFLNGNHKGHDYVVRPHTIGNCDCGDTSQWEQSGFCTKHKGIESNNHPEEYLDEELRKNLTDVIFKAAFTALRKLSTQDENNFYSTIFQFISSFLQFGDGFRRLISISLTQRIDFDDFIMNITDYKTKFNEEFQKFCGNLVNDQLFICNFSKIAYKLIIEKINPKAFQALTENKIDENYSTWNVFWFHAFMPSIIHYNIKQNNWDWVSFAIQFSLDMKNFFTLIGNPNYTNNVPSYISEIIQSFSEATKIQPNEQTQLFFDRLFTEVISSGLKEPSIDDSIVPVSFKDSREKMFYFPAQMFNLLFYPIFNSFKSKENLKFDKMFEQLDKLIYISPIFMLDTKLNEEGDDNENNQLVLKYLKDDFISPIVYPSYYYESFHNGASFFFSLPLYDSLVSLFNLDNMSKIKIAKFLLNEKYQSLRVKLGIITLRKVLSFTCFQQSLISKNNFNLSSLILNFANSAVVASSGLSKYLPLLQLLIGLKCNDENNEFSIKEFFSFEMARELGLLDDYESDEYKDENIDEKYKQMVFCFLYNSILFVIERILFNLNINNFIQEQLISALKKGAASLADLMNSYDRNLLENLNSSSIIYSILSKIADPRNKAGEDSASKDVSYALKDGVKWNTVSAIIPIGDQKTLINNEITKNKDDLINIQEFEPEETFFFHSQQSSTTDNDNDNENNDLMVHLREFLMTPTVLAIIYHTLRTSLKNTDINDHFAMNILVLISKFMKKESNKNEEKKVTLKESTVIIYSSICELVSALKENVFNYKEDKDGNATIENTLNSVNFAALLKAKISYDRLPSLSFIDILQEKGKIGKNVISQLSENLEIKGFDNQDSTDNEKMKEDEKKKKKNRANKIKDEIMNHYRSLITNYTMTDSETRLGSTASFGTISSSGLMNYEGDFCSVCSTLKKNEALSYPVFIYQTKFPFIIDKPPEAREGEKLDHAIEITCDDDADFEGYNENEEENDSNSLNHQVELQQEIIHDSQLLTSILQDIETSRDQGTITNEELANRFQFVALMRQNVLFKMQLLQQQQYMYQLKQNQKKSYEKRKEQFEKEGNVLKGKRFTAGANFILQFQICQHLLHPSCIDSKTFNCPIDRSLKNGFLPCLEGLLKPSILSNDKDVDKCKLIVDSLSSVVKNSIEVFLNNFKSHITNDSQENLDIFVELIKSISGLIATYEVRLRSLPDCLDSNNTKLLARNLFLTTWYAYRIHSKPTMCDRKPYTKPSFLKNETEEDEIEKDDNIEVESRLTEFQKFIKRMIECDDIEDNQNGAKAFNEIVNSFIKSDSFKQSSNNKRNEKELCLFLRRVSLADYFLLDGQNISIAESKPSGFLDLVDWDELLSVSNLSSKYKIQFSTLKEGEEFEFKPFTFATVPKEFLRFSQAPYNFPVDDTMHYSLFNLLNYNKLIKTYNDFDDVDETNSNNEEEEETEMKNDLILVDGSTYNITLNVNFGKKHYPSAFIYIGRNASKIAIAYQGKIQENSKPFYLDKYGSPDIGFQREQPLFLNEERYERFVDEVLSGYFIQ